MISQKNLLNFSPWGELVTEPSFHPPLISTKSHSFTEITHDINYFSLQLGIVEYPNFSISEVFS